MTISEETPPQAPASRDAANWAKPVDRLSAGSLAGASVDTVTGRRVAGPLQGFGQLWQKTFKVRLDGVDMPLQSRVAFAELSNLLVGVHLRRRELPDNLRQPEQPIGYPVEPVGPARLVVGHGCLEPGKICGGLRLLIQQKLHRPLHLFRRHRLKIHEKTSVSTRPAHYPIVVVTTLSKERSSRPV